MPRFTGTQPPSSACTILMTAAATMASVPHCKLTVQPQGGHGQGQRAKAGRTAAWHDRHFPNSHRSRF